MYPRVILAGAVLVLASGLAHADDCHVTVAANDAMQFDHRELLVPSGCTEIELTLVHTGKAAVAGLAHNLVVARSRDVAAIASAGMAAGSAHHYQPPGDARVIAATPLVAGGNSATVRFDAAALAAGGDFAFFCSVPGHTAMMKGRLVLRGANPRETASP